MNAISYLASIVMALLGLAAGVLACLLLVIGAGVLVVIPGTVSLASLGLSAALAHLTRDILRDETLAREEDA